MTSEDAKPATKFLENKIISLRINQIAHYSVCERYLQRHRHTDIALVVLSTISLGATFVDTSNASWMTWIIPVVAISVALLSAILTFMGDQPQAMDHQSSAVAYGALLRECESRVSGVYTEKQNADFLPEFLRQWRAISSTSPLTTSLDRSKIEDNVK